MKNASLCALVVALIAVSAAATNRADIRTNQVNHSNTGYVSQSQSNNLAQATPGEGDPMPTCYPGKNCGDTRLKEIAGEGDPMPTCYPGKNCGGNTQLKEIAGEGDPMPTCYPGKNCGDTQWRGLTDTDPFRFTA